MINSIVLQNFKSFGEQQTIPLQPVTVLVGPNNSGKSNLVSLARFIRNAATVGTEVAVDQEGGIDFVLRRPAVSPAVMRIGWTVDEQTDKQGAYEVELECDAGRAFVQKKELLGSPDLGEAWQRSNGNPNFNMLRDAEGVWYGHHWPVKTPMGGLHKVATQDSPRLDRFRHIWTPLVRSREIKLSVPALRQDSGVVPNPQLGSDGTGMAAVLGLWRGADLKRAQELDDFITKCLPEISRVLVKPGPTPGEQRLWVEQKDGEQFDAAHISDGVLCFIALAMHAVDAEPGALLFIEEPEQSIHPRRIRDLVELFRSIAYHRKCQIVVVTHSPILLHELRDEPESILLFRRDEARGTRVDPLTSFPDLIEALETKKADPGNMLVDGFFNDPS